MAKIPNQRALIDRRLLAERLDSIAWDGNVKSPETRARVLAAAAEALKAGRAEVRHRLDTGTHGLAAAHATSFVVDQIIRCLHDYTVRYVYRATNPTAGERLSVVAVGGYGRGEMAPFSDVDLLFLHPYKVTAWGEQTIEYLLYLLWDLGFKVGQAIRNIDECIRMAKQDVTVRTALLEARFLWGDQDLYDELRRRFAAEVVEGTGYDFVEAKLAERDARHKRLGDSRYLVEPNVKDGKGGLRDLHTLFWIGKYLYGVNSVDDLVEKGVLNREELTQFRKAEDFLWTVRFRLHLLAKRAEERLTFDRQPEIAEKLRYRSHGRIRPVERFMKHYFLVAKTVGDLTRIFCAQIEDQQKRKPRFSLARLGFGRHEVDGFVEEGGRLSVAHEDDFARDPVKMVAVFDVAQERGVEIHPNTLRLLTQNLRAIDDRVRRDPEANARFLSILTSRQNPETTLRQMNESGVFGRFVPDFGRVVAQMQHDMYHVYTVDEHTIRAIGILSEIEKGTLDSDHPLATKIVHEISSRRGLYLAVLLHDIAKGRGGDHSELGAEVAERLCPRLGLDAAETETVAWLVRYHLAMSTNAFKRDIHDPKTIADFRALVQSPERLRLLLVLTVADIRAVGPGRWNGWRGELLRDLYHTTLEAMSGGLSASATSERAAAAHDALRRNLPDWSEAAVEHHVARFYRPYWLSVDRETQARHARLMRDADSAEKTLAVATHIDTFRAVTTVTVYTTDHPGLFALIAGAIAVSGASIVDAKVHTTSDGMAIDTFWIQADDRTAFDRPDRLKRLSQNIEKALLERMDVDRLLAQRAGSLPSRTSVFVVPPRVLIDNKASSLHTVIEINARDRPGLLYDVTRALSRLGLSIASAHITTYGERAVDVFYVKDVFGLKIDHETKLERIRAELMPVLVPQGADVTASAAE